MDSVTPSQVHEAILDNMGDGVMTVDLESRVTAFNPAASRLLGLDRDEVLGRPFGETFLMKQGMDEFSQVLLDAVQGAADGLRRVVEVRTGEATRSFTLVASYLRANRDGEVRTFGVVAVFGDITEVKELRETELRLARQIERQHGELQSAYIEVEEKNAQLSTALRKVQVARAAATSLIVALFVAVGAYFWRGALPGPTMDLAASARGMQDPSAVRSVTVVRRPVSSTISLAGKIEPLRTVYVASPISGRVAKVHFEYGARVTRGQRLLDLDAATARKEHRAAQIEHVRAQRRLDEIEHWANGAEATAARRAVRRAEKELERLGRKLEETAFLLKRGVIPAAEHEAAERALRNQEIDLAAARGSLEAILAKGGPDARRIARLEFDNAVARLRDLEQTLERTAVDSPVDGIILQPEAGRDGGTNAKAERISRGRSVSQGEFLLGIGDLGGFSVRGLVDEVDIARIRHGQTVRIGGDAFPGLRMQGEIVHVSSQADGHGERTDAPSSFRVTAAVRSLTTRERETVRLGMSANLEIVVYQNPNALTVPIGAVLLGGGEARVRLRDRVSGALREVPVVPGFTTMDAVEIVAGLEPGDEIVLPR
jgi:PAS domain S-box-containing protein